MKQFLNYNGSEAYGTVTNMIKMTGCSVEGDQMKQHNTRSFFNNGVISDLYATCSGNTRNGASTIRAIVGTTSWTDGNVVVTFASGSGATTVSDTSNTDAITSGEQWAWEIDTTAGSTGTLTATNLRHVWEADSGSVTICGTGGPASIGIGSVSINYVNMFGRRITNTDEIRARSISSAPGTWEKLTVAVVGTTSTTVDVTSTARINGADGNQSVFCDETASEVLITDSSNTDTLSAGDNMGIEIDCTAHSGDGTNIDIEGYYSQITSTGDADYTQCMVGGTRAFIDTSGPYYFHVSGGMAVSTTEADMQTEVLIGGTSSHMANYYSQGTGSANLTARLRINGADGNQVTVSTGLVGVIDTSNTDDITAGDLLSMSASIVSGNRRMQASALRLTEAAAGPEAGAGSASGTATVSGAGAATHAGAGTSAAQATVAGIGAATAEAIGAAAAQAAVDGIASAIAAGAGAAAATATVDGQGSTEATESGAGAAAGQASVAGVAAAIHAGAGAAMAAASANGAGEATAAAVGAVAAQALAQAVGAAVAAGIGTIAGTAVASGAAGAIAEAAGAAAAQATVSGAGSQDGLVAGAGAVSAQAIAAAVGSAIFSGIGAAAATAGVSGSAAAIAAAAGSAAGQATVAGAGETESGSIESGAGLAAAQASVTGVAASIASALGFATGDATASGIGASVAAAAGSVIAQATASGAGQTPGAIATGSGTHTLRAQGGGTHTFRPIT